MNFINLKITNTTRNSTVLLIVDGQNLSEIPFLFEIWKRGGCILGICAPDSNPFNLTATGQMNNRVFIEWNVGDVEAKYYFKAFVFDKNITSTSDLEIKGTGNQAPVALISLPNSTQFYKLGDVINFTSASYDIDDPIIAYQWDFGDGTNYSFYDPNYYDIWKNIAPEKISAETNSQLSSSCPSCIADTGPGYIGFPWLGCPETYIFQSCIKYVPGTGCTKYEPSERCRGSLSATPLWVNLTFSSPQLIGKAAWHNPVSIGIPKDFEIRYYDNGWKTAIGVTGFSSIRSCGYMCIAGDWEAKFEPKISDKWSIWINDSTILNSEEYLVAINELYLYTGTNPVEFTNNVTHAYPLNFCKDNNCTINITLKVTDARGNSSNITQKLYLNDPATNQPPVPVIVLLPPTTNNIFHLKPKSNITFDASKTFDDIDNLGSVNQMKFNWSFDDGSTNIVILPGSVPIINKSFNEAGYHHANLTVTDSGGNSSTATVNFSISGCGVTVAGECVSGESYICNTSEQKEQRADLCDHCSPGTYSNGSTCSPPGNCKAPGLISSTCSNQVGCFWLKADSSHCEYCNNTDVSPKACKDYKDIDSCTNDRCDIGKTGIGSGICGKTSGGYKTSIQSCMCKWNDGNCTFFYSRTNASDSTQAPEDCIATITTTEKETVTEVLTELNCSGIITTGKETIHKPGALPIPFFTFWNMVIAIGAVAAAYIVINNLKKKPGKKRKARK